jgi:UTP--glucose-1-phosphate uridylyltransferase
VPIHSPTVPIVRRAVLPAAGRGTRMAAVRGAQAKELLDLGGRPLIAHGLHDVAAAGVTQALVIVSRDKPELERTLGHDVGGVALRFAVQPRPDGLADALALAESFTDGEPFLCWLPDNVWSGAVAASVQVASALARVPTSHLVALMELPAADLSRYGSAGFVETTPVAGTRDLHRIDRVLPKGTRPAPRAATILKGFPFFLYQHDLFDRIRRERAGHAGRELDDTPILMKLAEEGRLHGVVLRGGSLFDCGIPEGYCGAVAALGP